jgi:hypothetical protein
MKNLMRVKRNADNPRPRRPEKRIFSTLDELLEWLSAALPPRFSLLICIENRKYCVELYEKSRRVAIGDTDRAGQGAAADQAAIACVNFARYRANAKSVGPGKPSEGLQ